MLNINKQEINLNAKLKKKIDWAKNYAAIDIKVLKGHLIRLEPTNIAYIEPHKVIINEVTFMFFNDVDYFYVNDFDKTYNFSMLDKLFKLAKDNI